MEKNFPFQVIQKLIQELKIGFICRLIIIIKKRNVELKKLFIDEGLDIIIFKNDINYGILHRKKIRKIYNSITGQITQNSMMVYSGPIGDKFSYVKSYFNHWPFWKTTNRSGCVYSGDGDFNSVNIRTLFLNFWDKVGTIQIPHHGDLKCFSTNFFDYREYFCPMSVGKNNTYGHPSAIVTSSILANNSIPINVTEHLNSGFIQIIF